MEETPVGPVPGTCKAPSKCKATSAPGEAGKGNALDQGMAKLGEMLGKMLGDLMKGGGGGSGDGGKTRQGRCRYRE